MTHPPEEPDDPSGHKLDEDAAWRDIVAHYGDRPSLDEDPPSPPPPAPPAQPARPEQPPADREERLRGLFQPSWSDPLDSEATYDDEGHFVPPEPPPPPTPDPRRRLAWAGLFGSPTLMLVAVVLGFTLPGWFLLFLAGSFAGGFVYLVATMTNRRPGDGSGGDGAVV
jgi:hypothetical protein